MANWKRRLDIKEDWQKADGGEISIQDLAASISKKLQELDNFGIVAIDIDLEKQDLIVCFDDLAKNQDANTNEFDSLMEELYNWGDISLDGKLAGDKVCWIGTI
ncbi:MAG: hypothetical protein Q7R95_11305 [bacterium]|nr:hypothetical protein [bacterium]